VAKTSKELKGDKSSKEKLFLNIVQSDKIDVPSKTSTPKGNNWSVPYSLGPPHMEKDKNGENAPCFDCCFHPDAIALGVQHKEFKDLLVHTAIDGVQGMYKKQGQDVTIDTAYRVVKGIDYKTGQVPTMMMASAARENWKVDDDEKGQNKASVPPKPTPEAEKVAKKDTKPAPAIKKGFLSNSKGALYGDKMTTVRPREPKEKEPVLGQPISLVDQALVDDGINGINDLRIPTSTAAKSREGARLIEEVDGRRPVEKKAAPPVEKVVTKSVDGLKAVSTTTRTVKKEVEVEPLELLPQPSTDTDGLETPAYTVKERGHISMGDFEAFNGSSSNPISSRPGELIYSFQLPKISKASLIVLDIAERQLSLSYPGLYTVSLRLPYPVFDAKGTAKYEKASKSLTVVLKVQPPTATQSASPVKAAEFVQMEPTTEAESVPGSPPAPGKPQGVSHSRWVGSKDSISTGESKEEAGEVQKPMSLKEEIMLQAERAVKEAEAAKATTASKPVQVEKKSLASVAPPSSASEQVFQAAAKFAGKREGYVFQRGDSGVGYYSDPATRPKEPLAPEPSLDTVLPPPAPKMTKSESKTTPSGEAAKFSYACRQTKAALAVIVQVPNIDPTSVRIEFKPHRVSVAFQSSGASQSYACDLVLSADCCPGGLSAQLCTYDVAAQNMALVLTKQVPGYWHTTQEERQDESKNVDLDSTEAGALVSAQPYTNSVVRAVVKDSRDKVSADAAVAKALQSYEKTIKIMQFDNNDALFELD